MGALLRIPVTGATSMMTGTLALDGLDAGPNPAKGTGPRRISSACGQSRDAVFVMGYEEAGLLLIPPYPHAGSGHRAGPSRSDADGLVLSGGTPKTDVQPGSPPLRKERSRPAWGLNPRAGTRPNGLRSEASPVSLCGITSGRVTHGFPLRPDTRPADATGRHGAPKPRLLKVRILRGAPGHGRT